MLPIRVRSLFRGDASYVLRVRGWKLDMEDIHSERFIKGLFDEMSKTYGVVNILSSLGFAYLWRRQTVSSISSDATRICDLMAGGAECLSHIKRRFGTGSEVFLVDWSESMCNRADSTIRRKGHRKCTVANASALSLPVGNQCFDAVVSTFGLKTLSSEEIGGLAKEVRRVLKPGGSVSILEFSMPPNPFVRFFFGIYVKFYVPLLGWVLLGNPDNYRMLWRYTKKFNNCQETLMAFRKEGFEVCYKSRFFGSATQIIGYAQRGE